MTKVFIGGSRRISRLNKAIKDRIDNIIQNEYIVLIGDANGADKAVQNYLFDKNYRNVLVFCMGDKYRNNIGNWQIQNIEAPMNKKGFSYYSIKDLEMARAADYGFMIWDAKSNGTLNNVVNLLKENKKTLLYFSPNRIFFTLTTIDNLKGLLAKCDRKYLDIFEEKLKISSILKNEDQRRTSNLLKSQPGPLFDYVSPS
jgi:hypothetical protein